jgi:hypothetical protein
MLNLLKILKVILMTKSDARYKIEGFTQKFYERLYKVVKEENLIVFIGAGVSRIGGSLLWKDLAKYLVGDLLQKTWLDKSDAKILIEWADNNPRKSISICFKKCDTDDKKTYLLERIKEYSTCKNLESVRKIYNLLLSLEAKAYITTNVGKELIEFLPSLTRTRIYNCTNQEQLRLVDQDPAVLSNGNIFYLHGNIDNLAEAIFCIDKYINHYDRGSLVPAFLKRIFSLQHTVLFVGYSLSELEILEHLIRKSSSDTQLQTISSNFVLVPVKRKEYLKERLNEDYYHYFDLSVQPYDVGQGRPEDYKRLEDVISEIHKRIDPHKPKVLDVFNQIDEVLEGNVNN